MSLIKFKTSYCPKSSYSECWQMLKSLFQQDHLVKSVQYGSSIQSMAQHKYNTKMQFLEFSVGHRVKYMMIQQLTRIKTIAYSAHCGLCLCIRSKNILGLLRVRRTTFDAGTPNNHEIFKFPTVRHRMRDERVLINL